MFPKETDRPKVETSQEVGKKNSSGEKVGRKLAQVGGKEEGKLVLQCSQGFGFFVG